MVELSTAADDTKGKREMAEATKAMVNIVEEVKTKGVYGYMERRGWGSKGRAQLRTLAVRASYLKTKTGLTPFRRGPEVDSFKKATSRNRNHVKRQGDIRGRGEAEQ